MPNNQLIRNHGEIEYEPGATKEIDLPRSHFYERLNLVADYEVTSDGSDGKAGNGILDLIDRVEVQFDGSSTLKSTDFATSHFIDQYDYGTRPLYTPFDHTSASTQTGKLQTFVDFILAPGQYGALLPSFIFSDLTLSIKWGTPSSVGSDVTSVDSATVAVESKERRKNTVANPPQVTTSDITESLLGFKERQRTVPIDYDGEHTIDLPRGNTYYGVGVQVLDGDAPDNDLIEGVKIVENGVETHKSTTFDLARAKDKQEYGVESRPDGFVMLDYGIRGDTDDVVSTTGMDDFELLLDTDGTTPTDPAEARVVTREIVQ
jgi:hypothetical protein